MTEVLLAEQWSWFKRAARFLQDALGRILSPAAMRTIVSVSLGGATPIVADLASQVSTGAISLGQWHLGMRGQIKMSYIQQYLEGIGGVEMMNSVHWGSVGGMVADQYRYLDGFAAEIAAGNLSEAQIAQRAEMYIHSSKEAYERANGRARGVPEGALPAYPGDGSTICLTNCMCYWDISTEFEAGQIVGWSCYWTLSTATHCDTCLSNTVLWNPLVLSNV